VIPKETDSVVLAGYFHQIQLYQIVNVLFITQLYFLLVTARVPATMIDLKHRRLQIVYNVDTNLSCLR